MFTHLHVHTEYSLLDGLSRIPQLVSAAKNHGMKSLAITDHGSLYGVIDFYTACRQQGINPIIGCEIYEAQGSRFTKDNSERKPAHLTVLAQNNTGYNNLIHLSTKSHLEGFYYRPRIDDELLQEHQEGLIVLSGCPNAKIPRLISEGRLEDAINKAKWYKEILPERFYLELQEHAHIPELPAINKGLISISKTLDIPIVATNDSHYTTIEEAPFQDLRICISTNATIHDPRRLKMEDNSFYLKSSIEMAKLFNELPEAITNTQLIAEMCQTTIQFGEMHLPSYPIPNGSDADTFLAEICWKGLERLYESPTAHAQNRLQYELEVIRQTNFANYFLVVWDIAYFAKKQSILMGVRGSAAASLALYCLGVTEIDPLAHNLVFERFLNLERKEMPDIDMDFQDDRREEILNYVTKTYGSDKVAQIITFGTLGPKGAIRDVGRAMAMSYGEVDKLARMIPFRTTSIDEAIKEVPSLKEIYNKDQTVRDLLENAKGLEGISHHVSTHAAGVVISEKPLTQLIPLQRPVKSGNGNEIAMTQYGMQNIAELGLLKMDFLGLTNLTIIDKTLKLLKANRGLQLSLNEIPLDDSLTFELLSSGLTNEVFQLESEGMQRNIKELKPSSVSDVAAMIALYRPGPMEQIPTFIDSKHARIPVKSPHPSLDTILEDTYGVIVYQDQVLRILQTFAGYTLGSADIVRKAMGKKIPELMRQERQGFIKGAENQGFTSKQAQEIFKLIEPFAGYAFNKAHSVSYALISYWNAFFKANFQLEYMTSVLNARRDNPERMANAITECMRMGIPIHPPNINLSEVEFAINKDGGGDSGIRFGLAAIKNLGSTGVTTLIGSREQNGIYKSIGDFSRKANLTGLNRRSLESLIKAGTFDSLGNRGSILNSIDAILAHSQMQYKMKSTGQTNLFEGHASQDSMPDIDIQLDSSDVQIGEKLSWERELLGVTLTPSPLSSLIARDYPGHITTLSALTKEMEGRVVTLLGQLSLTRELTTRNSQNYLVASIELLGGHIEVLVWPDALSRTRDAWKEGNILQIKGKVVVRSETISIYCDAAREYDLQGDHNGVDNKGFSPQASLASIDTNFKTLTIVIMESDDPAHDSNLLRSIIDIVLKFPGKNPLVFDIRSGNQQVRLKMPITVGYSNELHQQLSSFIGESKVSYGNPTTVDNMVDTPTQ
ncbi:DNA polymerase III subunit alpha [SAR202 cluster bacterium AC-409-J13_OGT_754m]|nr:DNA polymerase III subunit alpha [SAR202 cluster bacterium AC-409-J13_OGT_754m]